MTYATDICEDFKVFSDMDFLLFVSAWFAGLRQNTWFI